MGFCKEYGWGSPFSSSGLLSVYQGWRSRVLGNPRTHTLSHTDLPMPLGLQRDRYGSSSSPCLQNRTSWFNNSGSLSLLPTSQSSFHTEPLCSSPIYCLAVLGMIGGWGPNFHFFLPSLERVRGLLKNVFMFWELITGSLWILSVPVMNCRDTDPPMNVMSTKADLPIRTMPLACLGSRWPAGY